MKTPHVSRATFAVHAALGATVDQSGSALARELRRAYQTFNRTFFDARLNPDGCVLITAPGSLRALGDYVHRDEHGIVSRIRIRPSNVRRGLAFLRDVLLHEMVHAWVEEVLQVDERSYRGHGPHFAARCNAVGRLLELHEVAPKGRQGKPDCAQWPMCVRPPDYYPQPEPARARKRAPKPDGQRYKSPWDTTEQEMGDLVRVLLAQQYTDAEVLRELEAMALRVMANVEKEPLDE